MISEVYILIFVNINLTEQSMLQKDTLNCVVLMRNVKHVLLTLFMSLENESQIYNSKRNTHRHVGNKMLCIPWMSIKKVTHGLLVLRHISGMKCSVMIQRSWIQTKVQSNLSCVVLLSKSNLIIIS